MSVLLQNVVSRWWPAAVLLAVVLYLLPLLVQLRYTYEGGNHRGSVAVALLRGRIAVERGFQLGGAVNEETNCDSGADYQVLRQSERIQPRIDAFATEFGKPLRIVRQILPRPLRVKQLVLESRVGTGDAARTGLAAGAFYGVLYTLLSPLVAVAVFEEKPQVRVVPDYDHTVLQWTADCIVALRLGDIIIAVFKLLRARAVKGVSDTWQNIRSRA